MKRCTLHLENLIYISWCLLLLFYDGDVETRNQALSCILFQDLAAEVSGRLGGAAESPTEVMQPWCSLSPVY